MKNEYQSVFKKLKKDYTEKHHEATNLLCLSARDGYWKSDVKIMMIGQETNDWFGEFGKPVEELQANYESFFYDEYGTHSIFWTCVHSVYQAVAEKLFKHNITSAFLWNNQIKIGRKGRKGLPSEALLQWQVPAFSLFRLEMEFFRPNIVIYFTGHGRDCYVKKAFPDVTFESLDTTEPKLLSRVVANGLPFHTYRTYHPKYLSLKKVMALVKREILIHLNKDIHHLTINK